MQKLKVVVYNAATFFFCVFAFGGIKYGFIWPLYIYAEYLCINNFIFIKPNE
jgi:hypothetical protein